MFCPLEKREDVGKGPGLKLRGQLATLLGEAPRVWGKWGDDEPVPSALQARAPRLSALGPITPASDSCSHTEQGFPGDSGSKESASNAGDPGSISLESKESSPTPKFKSINSSVLSFLYIPTLTPIQDHWRNHTFD